VHSWADAPSGRGWLCFTSAARAPARALLRGAGRGWGVTTFLVLGAAGLLLLVLTLLLGDLVDGLGDGLGPDWLSSTALAAFLAAVGFAGALALQGGLGTGAATGVGVGAGVGAGLLAGLLTRSLTREDRDATPRSGHLVGATATVVSDVPADGYGTVALVVAGHPTRLNARSSDERPLVAGTVVRVRAVLSASAVQVEPETPTAPDGAPTPKDT